MTVQELIKLADIDEQVKLVCAERSEDEEPYDPEEVKGVQEEFISMLLNLKPKKRAGIIVFEKLFHDPDDPEIESVSPECYSNRSLLAFLKKIDNSLKPEVNYNESTSAKDLEKMVNLFPKFPQSHAFEFDEWEVILGWKVYEGNIDELGLQQCIYSLLYEMSFNGVTLEDQDERRAELMATVEEKKKVDEMPEDEREEYYQKHRFTLDDLRMDLGLEEETEAEKEEFRRKALLGWLKGYEWKYNNYLEMKKHLL